MTFLPTGLDTAYSDDPLDPSVAEHQQHHDVLHELNNELHNAATTWATGDSLGYDMVSGLWVPIKNVRRVGDTMTGALVIADATEATLTTNGGLTVGGAPGTARLTMDTNEIQAIGATNAAAQLDLNPHGGQVSVGAGGLVVAAGASVFMPDNDDAARIRTVSGDNYISVENASGHMSLKSWAYMYHDAQQHLFRGGTGAADAVMVLNGKNVATVETGTHTPTLTGMALGAGGTNTQTWAFNGGPNVGDVGTLTLHGHIYFPFTGNTYPTNPDVGLPSGFNVSPANLQPIGHVRIIDQSATVAYYGVVLASAIAGKIKLKLASASGAYLYESSISTVIPMTWAAYDEIFYSAAVPVVRV